MTLTDWFGTERPIVGMVHLPPLPGAPGATDGLRTAITAAVRDAKRLAAGGVDGLMIENYGDTPFYPDSVPKHTVAAMTRVGTAVREAVDCPIGINVLRNDAEAALSVAAAVEADYIRVNVHTGGSVTDQGLIEGKAHETLRLRDRLGVDTRILADLSVKHAAPLAERSVDAEVGELVGRGHADAVIVSGEATGRSVDTQTLQQAVAARDERGLSTPVLVGSGVTADSVDQLLAVADGAIVGTAMKEEGETTNPVSVDRVETLMAAVETVRDQSST